MSFRTIHVLAYLDAVSTRVQSECLEVVHSSIAEPALKKTCYRILALYHPLQQKNVLGLATRTVEAAIRSHRDGGTERGTYANIYGWCLK